MFKFVHTISMYSHISATAYSVIPLMVYVFPLLVCPYAKMLAVNIFFTFSRLPSLLEYQETENEVKKITHR
jgi:hypothetical protein